MSSISAAPNNAVLPRHFVEQVKSALEHLYDLRFLQSHPFANQDDADEKHIAIGSAAERIRSELLIAIEALSPGPGVAFGAPHGRLFQSAHLHYVEGLSMQEIALELGVSTRQVYRDLRRAEEGIAAVLWPRYGQVSDTPREENRTSLEAEIEMWELRPRQLMIRALFQNVRSAVQMLAQQRKVDLKIELPDESLTIFTDPSVAQQLLISMSSHAIKQATSGVFSLQARGKAESAELLLRYTVLPDEIPESAIQMTTLKIIRHLEWSVAVSNPTSCDYLIVLTPTPSIHTVLVIDDNQGLVDLVARYLPPNSCHVATATSGERGLELAHELTPSVILLDIMMPTMDGWEVLQALQNNPKTRSIPVIICSVFNDPDLAFSLGAKQFLSKPICRENVLAALHELRIL